MTDAHCERNAPIPHDAEPDLRTLIRRAREGSGEAYASLHTRYRPLLEAAVARFGGAELTWQERADLLDEADRVFLGAISSYDLEQEGVDFGLYAKICLRNGLVSEWRRMDVRRREAPLPLMQNQLDAEEDPAQYFEEEERFRLLVGTVQAMLSDFENRVWWRYVTGESVAIIARDLVCDERSVHNAIYRIRRKLRAKLSESRPADS